MLTLHIAGLRVYNGKSVIVESWSIVRGKEPRYPYLSSGIRWISCWRETLSILDVFSNNTNLSIATDDIRSPKTMSSVTCSRGKVKFSSSLNGSPTSSGLRQFSVASCLEV